MNVSLLTRSVEGERRSSVGWIVCVAATRDVVDGMVACPLGRLVSVRDCRDCRFLEATEADWRRADCATPEG